MFAVDSQVEFTLYALFCGGQPAAPAQSRAHKERLMKTRIIALATVLVAIAATAATAATRLAGAGCCPLCK